MFRESSENDELLHENDFLSDSHDDLVVEEDGEESKLFVQAITRVFPGDLRYKAAEDLISMIDADSLDKNAKAGTMVYLKYLKNLPNFSKYMKKAWGDSARLDNQGNYNDKETKFR